MVGSVTISRVCASDRENFIKIEICAKGKPLCRVEMAFGDFAQAITGLSTRPCEINIPKKIADAMAEQWGEELTK